MYFEKKNIKALTYLVVFVVLIVVVFFSYKTYNKFKTSNTLYNEASKNVNETLLINEWTSGNNAPIKPTTNMPQSLLPNEYSISFLIYLNDLQQTDTNKEQLIFIKGPPDDSELSLSIKSLRYNPHSDLRFTCKLQVDVEKTDINKLLNEENNNENNDENNDANENEGDDEVKENFSNTINNSNRIHDKIGSNVIDYFTVQNIYDSSAFSRLKLLGITLSNLIQIPNLPIVFMSLNQSELESCEYKKGDTEGFVNYGLTLKGIVFSCIMIENESDGKIKMSFRSQGAFSVNDFARTYFSGGGHHNAAGGMSMDSMEKTIDRFKKAVSEVSDQFQQ